MSDDAPLQHPPEFRRLCDDAVEQLRALAATEPFGRAPLIPPLHEMLARIDEQVDELDLREPGFAREQGLLTDASSALRSIDLDRGGPNVERYVERAIADIRRVAG